MLSDSLEWSPLLRHTVKAQNTVNGDLGHGIVSQDVYP